MAQLAEWSLAKPEVRGSNPDSGQHLYSTFVYCQLYWKNLSRCGKAKQPSSLPATASKALVIDVPWFHSRR